MKKRYILYSLLLSTSVFAQKTLDRVEPAFWWKGMKNTELQILVYGKDIANNGVQLSDGVQIKEIKKVENPNYLFITIDTDEVKVSKFKINVIKDNKTVESYQYELKQRSQNSASRKGFNSSDVIYLIMPDRFANGNPKNDSQPQLHEKVDRSQNGGRHGGDLEGVIKNLDYIKELGATAFWSTPLTEDNEKTYSYHGYASSDLYKIDSRYGTNDDFKRLSSELHRRDMKLIMDFVPNHWGLHHWMIQDLPSKDWIHYWKEGENGFKRSNYRQSTHFDTNSSKIDRIGCADGWFDTTMPDMNDSNPLYITYMMQNAIWWTEFANLDGLRVDTYPYNDRDGVTKWTKRIMDEYPNFNIVGEALMHSPAHVAYWQKDSKIGAIEGFNSQLPSVMDFPLHDIMATAINESGNEWDKGMIKIYDVLTNDFMYPNINNLLTLVSNHDVERINQSFNGDPAKYKLALSLIMTMRGIPQIYYGDEIGMQGTRAKGDGDIRRDFPGGWKGDPQNAFKESGRTAAQKEYFNFTKKLLNWRKNKSVIHTGKTTHYAPENNIYVYFRHNDKESVMVIINNSDKEQSLDTKRFQESIKNYTKGNDMVSGKEIDVTNAIILPAKSSVILELK